MIVAWYLFLGVSMFALAGVEAIRRARVEPMHAAGWCLHCGREVAIEGDRDRSTGSVSNVVASHRAPTCTAFECSPEWTTKAPPCRDHLPADRPADPNKRK